MRICSFLPSATEILYALGAGESVAGVTFECEYPPQAREKEIVVHTVLASGLTPLEIDEAVRKQVAAGGSLYVVDQACLARVQPDLVITQDLCRVCAIGSEDLGSALAALPSTPRVLSLEPHTLEDVFGTIQTVGEATGRQAQAAALLSELRGRMERVASASRSRAGATVARPRVLCLEWLSPLYQGGHWVPEMVALAGGDAVLATPGERSVPLSFEEVLDADPEVIIVMPCGFHLRDAVAQYKETTFPERWAEISAVRQGHVYAVDGNAYFSCPGPRLVAGIEIMHAILEDALGKAAADSPFAHLPEGSVIKIELVA